MLPLWILDLTNDKSVERREKMIQMLSDIANVHIVKSQKQQEPEDEVPAAETSVTEHADTPDTIDSGPDIIHAGDNVSEEEPDEESSVKSVDEVRRILEAEDDRNAQRNARRTGDYWYYVNISNHFEGVELDDEKAESYIKTEEAAKRLYALQEEIVDAGKDFIYSLRKSNCPPDQTITVVVLGDVNEKLTRLVFPSVAAILQKEKGRMLANHIHQGMEILGMLYVPCNANTYAVEERNAILRTLQEIEVQHQARSVRGYDHMLLYQDVQNRTECVYPLLSQVQQAEYVVQCLVHLFYACDQTHPLLQGTGNEDFYLSLGVASMYFDTAIEDEKDLVYVCRNIIKAFMEEGDNENERPDVNLLDTSEMKADKFFRIDEFLDITNVNEPMPSPHPFYNYLAKNLKRVYYRTYLKFYPARLMTLIANAIEDKTNEALLRIANNCHNVYRNLEMGIKPSIEKLIGKSTPATGALKLVENSFRKMQEFLSAEKRDIYRDGGIIDKMWNDIIDNNVYYTEFRDPFEQYHEQYIQDCRHHATSNVCESMKKEAVSRLCDHLSKQPTVLSNLAVTFICGIMCVLAIPPLIDKVCTMYWGFEDVKKLSFLLGTVIFMIPFLCMVVKLWLYNRTLHNLIRVLKAYYLHDAYARMSNRLEMEICNVYDKLILLGKKYLERCQDIRKEVMVKTIDKDFPLDFPESMFNQPLNGGTFSGDEIIPKEEIERRRIRINYDACPVNELNKLRYYVLIGGNKDIFVSLFSGVHLFDDHKRVYDDNINDYRFVSMLEQQTEMEKEWEQQKASFLQNLRDTLKDNMVPRMYPTITDKVIQYRVKTRNPEILRPLLAFAATNGELTSSADTEFADVKINNEKVIPLTERYLPIYSTRQQVDSVDRIFQKLIFITRWRCFDHFSYNRLFPTEDFDQDVRSERVYEDQVKKGKKKDLDDKKTHSSMNEEEYNAKVKNLTRKEYAKHSSSIILWSLYSEDKSNVWYTILDPEYISKDKDERDKYIMELNKND